MTYTVTIPQLPALQEAFERAPLITKQEVSRAINRSLAAYQSTAKQLAPIDKGHLRASIQISPARSTGNRIEGSVGTDAKHALWQEQGTGIYGPRKTPIRPKTKPMLAWHSGGKWHFAKEVKGSRPRWYMRGSLERNQVNTEMEFITALDNVTAAIAGRRR